MAPGRTDTVALIQVTPGHASCKTVSSENAEMTLPYAGTPDILIARTDPVGGRALGAELAAALGLPCQERQEPY